MVIVGFAAIRHRQAVAELEVGRREEAESFARILSSLSRSVSPDAILDAIVDELADATGADHIVVARRRPDARVLEATLVSARPGVPESTTVLPIGDLEDPVDAEPIGRREPVAIPVVPRSASRRAGGCAAGSTTSTRASGGVHRRARPSTPARHAAERAGERQLIADRIAARTRATYGLTDTLAAPLTSEGDRHRRDRPVAPDGRRLVGDDPAAAQRRGRRGVVGPVACLLAAGRRGAGLDRRPDRPAEPALLRRVLRPARAAAARRTTRSAC